MIATCPWTSAAECAMARERSVAGISDAIPTCSVHPFDPDDLDPSGYAPDGYYDPIPALDGSIVDYEDPRPWRTVP